MQISNRLFGEQIAARKSKDWFLADQILHISALL